jgi:hypothetical protein
VYRRKPLPKLVYWRLGGMEELTWQGKGSPIDQFSGRNVAAVLGCRSEAQ